MFVDIVHPEIEGVARVGRSALRVVAKSGWHPVSTDVAAPADDETPALAGDETQHPRS